MKIILGDTNGLINPLATSLMVDTLGKPLATLLMKIHTLFKDKFIHHANTYP